MQIKKQAGFTLVEAILMVAVVGVMMTLAFPDIISTFRFQREYSEEQRLDLIREGLEKYAQTFLKLPSKSKWWEELSDFVPLSETEILCDVWGKRRVYEHFTTPKEIEAQTYNIDYAVVLSYGEDGCLGNSDACVPNASYCASQPYTPPTPRLSSIHSEAQYAAFSATGGDYVTKYTTYIDQVAAHKETKQRLNQLIRALNAFAVEQKSAAYEELLATGGSVTSLVNFRFYPPSGVSSVPIDSDANYHSKVLSAPGLPSSRNGNSVLEGARRTYMEDLVRFLGLPDTHCCSAALKNTSGQDVPFFYYSNPRGKDSAGACHLSRASGGAFPAKVSDVLDVCG